MGGACILFIYSLFKSPGTILPIQMDFEQVNALRHPCAASVYYTAVPLPQYNLKLHYDQQMILRSCLYSNQLHFSPSHPTFFRAQAALNLEVSLVHFRLTSPCILTKSVRKAIPILTCRNRAQRCCTVRCWIKMLGQFESDYTESSIKWRLKVIWGNTTKNVFCFFLNPVLYKAYINPFPAESTISASFSSYSWHVSRVIIWAKTADRLSEVFNGCHRDQLLKFPDFPW